MRGGMKMVCFLSIFASKGVWRIQILRRGAQWRERMESGCVGGLCECNWWTCVRRNRSVGRRGIFWSYHFFLIICKASLWPRKALYKYYVPLCTKYLLFFILLTFTRENASKRSKKKHICTRTSAHWAFGFPFQSRYGTRPLSWMRIIRHNPCTGNTFSPQELRGGVCAEL